MSNAAAAVAIMTGASSGIGYATAVEMARRGYQIVLGSRDPERAAARLQTEFGVRVTPVAVDLAKTEATSALLEAVQELGTLRALFLNHGGPGVKPFMDLTETDWERAFHLMLQGPLRLLRACVPMFRKAGGGRVLAISSFSTKMPQAGIVLSNSLRAALVNALKTVARELGGEGILLNAVAPGYIETGRLSEWNNAQAARMGIDPGDVKSAALRAVPLGRYGTPEELAKLAAFLLSQDNTYVTGQQVLVDGGLVSDW
jgi:3-oxoacyl-[acyl-carrier protein] reductase